MWLMLACYAFQMHSPGFGFPFLLGLSTRSAKNSLSIDIALCDLVPPFLALRRPHFFLSALPTLHDLVNVKPGQRTVCVVVAELQRVGHDRTWRQSNGLVARIDASQLLCALKPALLSPLLLPFMARHSSSET
jgi:hypothetical protein